jgi:trafficking protein particle complex subunit 3
MRKYSYALPPFIPLFQYCSLLSGVLIGALEMVQMSVECRFVRDVLKGDDTNELRVELKGMVKNVMCDEYKET